MKRKLNKLGKCNKGFTLIEVIVVAAIIAILAGILVPMIFGQIDESKKTRAQGDIKSIHSAIIAFRKDAGTWPNKSDATTSNVGLLYTTGILPTDAILTAMNWGTANKQALEVHLKVDDNAAYGALWKGPYMPDFPADPWGNAYIVSASTFNSTDGAVGTWVLSMGPDGILQTPINASAPQNDDIAVRIR